ncbi:MAG: dockerin type I domain-containing protein [Planctomycetota bacterium]|jgi:hypothetical protein
MTEKMDHFDEEPDLGVSSKFSAELNSLFTPPLPVPPEVDRAVLDRVHKHFVRPVPAEGRRRRFRWAGLWRLAAAAAVVILAFSLDLTKEPGPAMDQPALTKAQAVDIDGNGRVDILDAFTLARRIESAGSTEEHWDINGDGLVDVEDVDMVAFAAVRLDKGVL